MDELAINGGQKVKNSPFGRGKRFGDEELHQLKEALDQNSLFYWARKKVNEFTRRFAEMYGREHCVATSSGTAAIHVALGTIGVGPGDEVITSPITDMGSCIGILYQNAIPVFCDLDPHTYNMDPASVESKITDKTKCILIVHLAGNPCDMTAIMEIANRRGVKVIEDCAQSYLSWHQGRLAGTFGQIGCFSVNDFKHISAGDGGMCLINDPDLFRKAQMFADKNYNRTSGGADALREIEFLAPNYRMTELQGAVALAQLDRLEWICARRNTYGDAITAGIAGLKGISSHLVKTGDKSSYWFYLLRVDEKELGINRDGFAKALAAEGISCGAGYIPACVYEYDLFKYKNAYPGTDCPWGCKYYNREIEYKTGDCPVAEEILKTSVRVNINEFYTNDDIDDIIKGINKVATYYVK